MTAARFIAPMKAVIDDLPEGDGWATELKWDGMRIQAHVFDGELTLFSGSGRDVTSQVPELTGFAAAVGVDLVLDGELVVFDGDRPSFARLQHRIHTRQPQPALLRQHPAVFIVFDLLQLDGTPLLELPYHQRRRLLIDLVEDGPSWRVPPHNEHGGSQLLALARERDLEGVVAKRLNSPYRPGRRSSDWVKVKVRKRQEFVVGGWIEGSGSLTNTIGSLIVGVYDGQVLRPAGSVGSGLRDVDRSRLLGLLEDGPCPFDPEPVGLDGIRHWVQPSQVVEVEYSLWTEGQNLWHPVFRGLRVDRVPTEVVREQVDGQ